MPYRMNRSFDMPLLVPSSISDSLWRSSNFEVSFFHRPYSLISGRLPWATSRPNTESPPCRNFESQSIRIFFRKKISVTIDACEWWAELPDIIRGVQVKIRSRTSGKGCCCTKHEYRHRLSESIPVGRGPPSVCDGQLSYSLLSV